MNLFKQDNPADEESERLAADLLAPIAAEQPWPEAADAAQAALVNAVATIVEPRGLGMRQRFALAVGALVMPLMAVGAVGAATGQGPLNAPVEAVSNAVGIGGNSGDHRNDFDNRGEAAGNNGQPGSCPGKACEAPGHNKSTATATASASASAEASKTKTDPHANGKGCDDKLFATGTPPFGGHDTPVGPCKAASSTPAANASATAAAGNGNGNGHEKDRGNGHEQGNGKGHEKYDAAGTPAVSTPAGSIQKGKKK